MAMFPFPNHYTTSLQPNHNFWYKNDTKVPKVNPKRSPKESQGHPKSIKNESLTRGGLPWDPLESPRPPKWRPSMQRLTDIPPKEVWKSEGNWKSQWHPSIESMNPWINESMNQLSQGSRTLASGCRIQDPGPAWRHLSISPYRPTPHPQGQEYEAHATTQATRPKSTNMLKRFWYLMMSARLRSFCPTSEAILLDESVMSGLFRYRFSQGLHSTSKLIYRSHAAPPQKAGEVVNVYLYIYIYIY